MNTTCRHNGTREVELKPLVSIHFELKPPVSFGKHFPAETLSWRRKESVCSFTEPVRCLLAWEFAFDFFVESPGTFFITVSAPILDVY